MNSKYVPTTFNLDACDVVLLVTQRSSLAKILSSGESQSDLYRTWLVDYHWNRVLGSSLAVMAEQAQVKSITDTMYASLGQRKLQWQIW